MKRKFLIISILTFSGVVSVFSRGGDAGAGENGSTGGLEFSIRMLLFSDSSTNVHIIDSATGLEIGVVLEEKLDAVIDNLPSGSYLLIYTDSDENVTEKIPLLKE